jgi:hypothetical protein
MVGFCSGKLLLQLVIKPVSNNHTQTNILVYQWEPEQMPGPGAKDQKKMIKNDQKVLTSHNDKY